MLFRSLVITRIGKGHYNVTSETELEVTYSVDIESNNFLGSCTCHNFTMFRFPQWKKNGCEIRDRYRCKHLRSVRSHVLDMILKSSYHKS